MKIIAFVYIFAAVFIFVSSAMAADKVVVVPLGGSKTSSNLAPVAKTGLGDCYYDDGITVGTCTCGSTNCPSGQDGDLKKGLAWPNPRFTDNNDGTITDNLTGLIWLENANCPNATRNWATALSDVAQLNSDGTINSNNCGDTSNTGGGHQTDWRLPNVKELQSLIHFGYHNPAVPNTTGTSNHAAGDPFNNFQNGYYWSSTSVASYTPYAWTMNMSSGNIQGIVKTTSYYVLPVRGGN